MILIVKLTRGENRIAAKGDRLSIHEQNCNTEWPFLDNCIQFFWQSDPWYQM